MVTRPGGRVGFVGVPHGVSMDGTEVFYSHVEMRGGPAPVRGYLPDLVERIVAAGSTRARSSTSSCPSKEAAEGYAGMDERRAIKALLIP